MAADILVTSANKGFVEVDCNPNKNDVPSNL